MAISNQHHFRLAAPGKTAGQRSKDDKVQTGGVRTWRSMADLDISAADSGFQFPLPSTNARAVQVQGYDVGFRSKADRNRCAASRLGVEVGDRLV